MWSLLLKNQVETVSPVKISVKPPVISAATNQTAPKDLPPIPKKYLFDTQQNTRHSIRIICDEEGLSVKEKNLICAVIEAESDFNNNAKRENIENGKVWSTDWGICQINDYYHVKPTGGREFTSVEEILENPDEAVRFMIACYKTGNLHLWVSYSSGAYEKFLSS